MATLVIRKEQMEVLSLHTLKGFEDQAVAHLNKFFPDQCKGLSPSELRAVIQHGIERAKYYNIVTEQDIGKYLNLMFAFGQDFDTEQPWAARVLAGRGKGSQEPIIDRLYGLALVNENRAMGLKRPARRRTP